MEARSVFERILAKDASLFSPDTAVQTEVSKYMGWLDAPDRTLPQLPLFDQFRQSLVSEGFTDVAVLGMGGSSLSSLVWSGFEKRGGLRLHVLDSTHPSTVLALGRRLDLATTLTVVASKSGSTVEPLAFEEHFWARLQAAYGDKAGSHMVAVTDPGSQMQSRAEARGYRRVFLGEPEVGGRFSAFTVFGLLPAALAGLDTAAILRGQRLGRDAKWVQTGLDWAERARKGEDKLILPTGPCVDALALWMEQLVAESTGKNGHGVLPVAMEPPGAALGAGRTAFLLQAGDEAQVGETMYGLMLATAAAGAALGVNPFDQPDVQAAKLVAQAELEKLRLTGLVAWPEHDPGSGAFVVGEASRTDFASLKGWLASGARGGYVSLGAFVCEETAGLDRLQSFRAGCAKTANQVSTLGLGPRYLHSTGQYHKGGPANGSHLVLTDAPTEDVPIPGMGATFGQLCAAQALGDLGALRQGGRRSMWVHLGAEPAEALDRLVTELG